MGLSHTADGLTEPKSHCREQAEPSAVGRGGLAVRSWLSAIGRPRRSGPSEISLRREATYHASWIRHTTIRGLGQMRRKGRGKLMPGNAYLLPASSAAQAATFATSAHTELLRSC